jgi:hypothetical protein
MAGSAADSVCQFETLGHKLLNQVHMFVVDGAKRLHDAGVGPHRRLDMGLQLAAKPLCLASLHGRLRCDPWNLALNRKVFMSTAAMLDRKGSHLLFAMTSTIFHHSSAKRSPRARLQALARYVTPSRMFVAGSASSRSVPPKPKSLAVDGRTCIRPISPAAPIASGR